MRDGRSLVEFRPKTGRTHQIRAHAREGLGAGIVGDRVYGVPGGPMLLHAVRLVVPRGAKPAVDATAPLPEAFGEWRALAQSMPPPDPIPEEALSEKFLAATGPGGQNVNKVATACQLRCNVFALGLSPQAYARLRTIAGTQLTAAGELIITARRFRTQEANREDARAPARRDDRGGAYRPGQASPDPAQPRGEGEAGRREEGPFRSEARPRESEFRLMYDFKLDAADKPTLYRDLAQALAALVEGEPDPIANMANAAALIWESVPGLNWAGFYRNVGGELVLGPFQGRPACIRIPFGKGVCGAAAASLEVQRVDDVHQFPGHIACDAASVSELVVPIVGADGKLIAVLDLDSPEPARFDAEDEAGFSELVHILNTNSNRILIDCNLRN